MKFVGLLSGGKDSCYNIMKCLDYGHELICLGNLSPPSSTKEQQERGEPGQEMNSYMYQTAGYNMLNYIAQCMNTKLIIKELRGRAVQQTLDYQETVDDEVEDLFELLKEIKETYPDLQGVSCGTIISSYQRYRVENVCERLGLVPLTYLWQRPRKELLEEMLERGIEAVLVKVAGAGLLPEKHLGKSLSELYPTICRLNERFQLDYCGEGGEYESFVINCPLFQTQRIQIIQSEIVYDAEDPSVGNLWITECRLIAKEDVVTESIDLDKTAQSVSHPSNISNTSKNSLASLKQPLVSTLIPRYTSPTPSHTLPAHRLYLDCDGYCQSPLLYPSPETISHFSSQDEMESACVSQINDIFSQLNQLIASFESERISLSDVVFVHLYLSDMSLFEFVNSCYCLQFKNTKYPPSRVCVAIPLPPFVLVSMEVILLGGSSKLLVSGPQCKKREVLHVRSLSEWAPLCIGPYSQANVINNSWLYIAGQIALDPATMTMINSIHPMKFLDRIPSFESCLLPSIRNEIYQSVLNYSNILNSLDSDLLNCLSGIVYLSSSSLTDLSFSRSEEFIQSTVKFTQQCIQQIYSRSQQKLTVAHSDDENDSEERESLDQSNQRVENYFNELPLVVIFVSQLPRNAIVEIELISVSRSLGNILHGECRNSRISHSHSQHLSRPSDFINSLKQECNHAQESDLSRSLSPKMVMQSMPIWESGYRRNLPLTPPPLEELERHERKERKEKDTRYYHSLYELTQHLSQQSTSSYSILTHSTNFPSCFSIGYSRISSTAPHCDSLLLLCIALLTEIYQTIVEREIMTIKDLKTIKFFYPVGCCQFKDLHDALFDAFHLVMINKDPSLPFSLIQIIPTQELPTPSPSLSFSSSSGAVVAVTEEGQGEGQGEEQGQGQGEGEEEAQRQGQGKGEAADFHSLFSVQFIFLNFLQIKSELWIASTEMS